MNSLMVYLKSMPDTFYRYSLAVSALLLAFNGIKQFEGVHNEIIPVLASLILAAASLLVFALHKKVTDKFKLAMSFLMVISGAFLIWNAKVLEMILGYEKSAIFLFYTGITMGIVGFLEPFLNCRTYIRFSKNSIRIRESIVTEKRYTWDEIKSLDFDDEYIEIALFNGKKIKVWPLTAQSHSLRSRVDHFYNESKIRQASGNTPAGDIPVMA